MVNHDYFPHLISLGHDPLPVGSLAKHVHQLYGLVLPMINHDYVSHLRPLQLEPLMQ